MAVEICLPIVKCWESAIHVAPFLTFLGMLKLLRVMLRHLIACGRRQFLLPHRQTPKSLEGNGSFWSPWNKRNPIRWRSYLVLDGSECDAARRMTRDAGRHRRLLTFPVSSSSSRFCEIESSSRASLAVKHARVNGRHCPDSLKIRWQFVWRNFLDIYWNFRFPLFLFLFLSLLNVPPFWRCACVTCCIQTIFI